MRKFLIILMTVAVGACAASGDQRDRFEEMAVFERHAGATENWVRYTRIRNWWAVGYHSVVFEMNQSRHYLVELIGACDLDLNSAVALRLTTSRRNVLSEFDDVVVEGRACQIRSIRRLDYEAVKAELEAEDDSLPQGQGDVTVETESQSSGGT